ncbi:MAG: FAD-dependent thymidylate synthase [Alphaproteobacteria bacterium]|nr:FAD-dependent thymidylate synthase [Alphaproteobacteria bacterium]
MTIQNDYLKEIQELKAETTPTQRATVPSLEKILYTPISVLDHGFIRVIDYMGDDSAIVQAARVSYGKGTKKKTMDRGLINYLMRHRHSTPFEMCEIKLHVKLPIFVARQWIRHRTANINEYSARYSILDKEFYTPQPDVLSSQSTTNNQGRGSVLKGTEAERVLMLLKRDAEQCYASYEEMLNENELGDPRDPSKQGLTRELARINLPVSFYTQWYWKIDLHNLFHFMSLRGDPHAQYEIRAYVDVMLDIVKEWVPFAYEAFMEHKVHGAYFSKSGLDVIKRMISGETVSQETSNMSEREWGELMVKLGK